VPAGLSDRPSRLRACWKTLQSTRDQPRLRCLDHRFSLSDPCHK
jgi:hypothetical protein